ncbi:MAG: peptidoglycan-binding protein LysM [Geobacteraceae bacterium GWC2_55_20]|nr:MAG: peptidoglycan-binding protein LysM [Geobacteraceae bacterium GWC2_55_20]OGU21883.1 MAG: peptidoglycan-binding protein LysM [Geobacteraceae bacterium GWF2_54_21]HBA71630.1 peptidoglycan-binding protein LysM [Geobacter sp.]HCE66651.1 peptidoglycan-binding protein LysM [Geobacter sp.]
MKTRILLLLLALVTIPCFVQAAQREEPTIYVIKQGDTLWGISERFIKDPNYWPNMWSNNSQVTNPHFIYPGQKVRVFPDRLEFVPREQPVAVTQKAVPAPAAEEMREVAAEKSYTVFGSEGFILENGVKPAGMVIGIQNDRILAGDDDIVYTDIGSSQGARGGEKYSIFRKDSTVTHPVTNEVMGTKIIPLGTLQLTDLERNSSRAVVARSSKEISPGSYLLPYKGSSRREVSLKMSTRELKGYILDSYSGISIIAAGDIVYIDLGSAQGAEVGNILYIVRDVVLDQRYAEGRIDKLPQELLGALVILETGKKVATALVVKSIDAIYKGDRLVSMTK